MPIKLVWGWKSWRDVVKDILFYVVLIPIIFYVGYSDISNYNQMRIECNNTFANNLGNFSIPNSTSQAGSPWFGPGK